MDFSSIQDIDLQVLRLFNGSDNLFLDQMMQLLTSGFTWIPLYIVLLVIVIRNNETMGQIALIIGASLLCVVLADGLAEGIIKPLAARLRPINDPLLKYTIHTVGHPLMKDFSFCSAHAANTMAIAVFFSLLVRSRMLTWTLLVWSIVNCWTRLYLGAHYPSDIVCGLLLGSIVGGVVYILYHKMYCRISPKIQYISNQYTSTGYDHDDIDILMTMMVVILLYVVIRGTLMTFYC